MIRAARVMSLVGFSLLTALGAGSAEGQSRGPLSVADPACLTMCREELQDCLETARPEAERCEGMCEEKIALAREICEADRTSAECREAAHAARECLRTCQQGVRECVQAGRRCAMQCANPDGGCLLDCREDHQECVQKAREAARTCRAERCHDEYEKAREVCAEDRSSDDCQKALGLLRECLEACREEFQKDIRECTAEGHACARLCRDEESDSLRP